MVEAKDYKPPAPCENGARPLSQYIRLGVGRVGGPPEPCET